MKPTWIWHETQDYIEVHNPCQGVSRKTEFLPTVQLFPLSPFSFGIVKLKPKFKTIQFRCAPTTCLTCHTCHLSRLQVAPTTCPTSTGSATQRSSSSRWGSRRILILWKLFNRKLSIENFSFRLWLMVWTRCGTKTLSFRRNMVCKLENKRNGERKKNLCSLFGQLVTLLNNNFIARR